MACLEHSCRKCDHYWADNKPASVCPKCGSYEVTNDFDEQPSGREDRDSDEEVKEDE